MASALRIQYPGACYHVTCRGNERREIFRNVRDYKVFLEKLRRKLQQQPKMKKRFDKLVEQLLKIQK